MADNSVTFEVRADTNGLSTDLQQAETLVTRSAQNAQNAADNIAGASERANERVTQSARRAARGNDELGNSARNAGRRQKSFSEELKDVNALLEKDRKNTTLLAQKKEILSKAVEETSDKLRQLEQREESVNAAYREGRLPVEEYRDFQRQIIATRQELQDYEQQLRHVGDVSQNSGTPDSSGNDGGGFSVGKVAGAVGAGVAAVGAAAVGIAKGALDTANDLDKAVNRVISSTGDSAKSAKEYEEIIKGIYADNFGESFDDIAVSISAITQNLGELDNTTLQSVTESAYALKDVFDMDVSESARAAKAMSENLGVSVERAYDYIAKGAQDGLDFSGELIDTLNEYSVHFGRIGMDADDMFNIFEAGAENGAWNLDKIGDAIKEFSIRAVDGSNTTKEGFEALGLDAEKMAADFAKGGDAAKNAFDITVNALADIKDPLEQNTAGVNLFGTMWEDLGAQAVTALADITDKSYECAGAVDEIKEKNYSSFSDMADGLKRQIEVLLLPLGQEIMKIVDGELMDKISDMAENLIPKITDAVVPLIEKLIPLLDPLIGLVEDILPALFDIAEPILDGLVQIVETVLPPLTEFLSGELVPVLTEIITKLVETLMPVITELIQNLLPPVLDIMRAVLPVLQTLMTLLSPIIGLVSGLIKPIADLLNSAVVPLIEVLMGLINDILKPLLPIVEVLLKGLEKSLGSSISFITDILGDAIKFITDIINNARQILGGIIDFIAGVFTGDWERAWKGVSNIFEGVWNNIKSAAEFVVNALIDLINNFISGINMLFEWLGVKIEPLNKVDWTSDNAEEQAKEAVNNYNVDAAVANKNATEDIRKKQTAKQARIIEDRFDDIEQQTGAEKAAQGAYSVDVPKIPPVKTAADYSYSASSEDTSEDEYRAAREELDYRKNMGQITDAQYYAELAALRDKFLEPNSSEWRSVNVSIHNYEEGLKNKKGGSSSSISSSGSSGGNMISITSYIPTVWDSDEVKKKKLAMSAAFEEDLLSGNTDIAMAITGIQSAASTAAAAKTAEKETSLADVVSEIRAIKKKIDGIDLNLEVELKARELTLGKAAVRGINELYKKNGKSPFDF